MIVGLGMLFQLFIVSNLPSQTRDTPVAVQLFQKINNPSEATRAAEYWVEYQPCTGSQHCFVRVLSPNEATIDQIKKKGRVENSNTNVYQWKVTDGISLDKIGDVDGAVYNCPFADPVRGCEAGEGPD